MTTPFPFTANWSAPVRERLSFETEILMSQSGAEQRRAFRIAPRRTLRATLLLDRRDRAMFDHVMHGGGAGDFYVPVWPDGGLTTAQAAAGAATIMCSTAYREFTPTLSAILVGPQSRDFEVVTVNTVLSDRITITGTLAATWPAGTRIYPAKVARFFRQPDIRRQTDQVWEVQVEATLVQPATVTATSFGTTYRSHPVYEVRPDWSEDLSGTYQRLQAVLDNNVAAPHVVDTANMAFAVQSHRYVLHGGEERNALRRFCYALRGRQVSVWMPSHHEDFVLDAAMTSGQTTMPVVNNGYVDFGGVVNGRRDLAVRLRDGNTIYRRINSAVETSATRETLTLDSALGVAADTALVDRISLMRLVRSDDDDFEIEHTTDVDGVARAEITFRTLRDDV